METYEAIVEKSRYPGISPFSESQQNIFFGRDPDIQNLVELINVRRQVLLYAKSGVGKTSLLMAGVLPLLKNRYTPLRIRFTSYVENSDFTPIQAVVSSLPDLSGTSETLLDKINLKIDLPKTIWYHFKQHQLSDPLTVWLLVFDQFEELFTYPEKLINDFKQQLHDMIHSEIPGEIIDLLAEDRELTAGKQINILYEEPKIKIIYAIRSDRLNLLNQLTDKIPDIQRDFYELKPLDDKQARAAIEGPAGKEGDFTVPRFIFPGELMGDIMNRLTKYGKESLETTQLQIVCQRIEENIFRKSMLVHERSQVYTVDFKDIPDFKNIFYEFYTDSIKTISEPYQAKAHLLIENQLIYNRRRISLDGFICTEILPENELQRLVKAHLLRGEPNNMGGFNYELSHDTLVEPIYEAAEKRRKREKEEAAEREREKEAKRKDELLLLQQERTSEAEQAAKKQRKLKNTNIILAFLFMIAAVISGLKWIEADRNEKKAQMNAHLAEKNARKSDSLLTNITVKDYNKYLDYANNLADSGKYDLAIEQLDKAAVVAGDDKLKVNQITEIRGEFYAKTDNEQRYREMMAKARSYEQKEEMWPEAIKTYEEARLLNLHTETVNLKIRQIEVAVDQRLNEYRQTTDKLMETGAAERALYSCILPALKICSPERNRQFHEYFTQKRNEIVSGIETENLKSKGPLPEDGPWIIVFTANENLDEAVRENRNLKKAGIEETIIVFKEGKYFNLSREFPSREEAFLFQRKIAARVRPDVYVIASRKFCNQKINMGAYFNCR